MICVLAAQCFDECIVDRSTPNIVDLVADLVQHVCVDEDSRMHKLSDGSTGVRSGSQRICSHRSDNHSRPERSNAHVVLVYSLPFKVIMQILKEENGQKKSNTKQTKMKQLSSSCTSNSVHTRSDNGHARTPLTDTARNATTRADVHTPHHLLLVAQRSHSTFCTCSRCRHPTIQILINPHRARTTHPPRIPPPPPPNFRSSPFSATASTECFPPFVVASLHCRTKRERKEWMEGVVDVVVVVVVVVVSFVVWIRF